MTKRKADVLEQKSPAEFFAENKNIAGFDNVSQAQHLSPSSMCKNDFISLVPDLIPGCFAAWKMLVHNNEGACGERIGLC